MIHSLFIVDYAAGHVGSAHDALAFRDTRLYNNHSTLLRNGEWVWADSAYGVASWLVSPFKQPGGGEITPDQSRFNYYLSRLRVRVEHAIGLLKGRFQSLRELRIQISSTERHRSAVRWIQCCITLHNLIIMIEGDNDDEQYRNELIELGKDNNSESTNPSDLGLRPENQDEGEGEGEDEDDDDDDDEISELTGQELRDHLMDVLLATVTQEQA